MYDYAKYQNFNTKGCLKILRQAMWRPINLENLSAKLAVLRTTLNMASETITKRILVIDDNSDAADLVAELLEIYGYSVRTAYSGPDGLIKAFAFTPHLVLLDLGMPGMDGFAVASTLRGTTNYPQPYIVAYTAWNDVAVKERVKTSGFDYHMTKPANFQDIVALVSTIPQRH